MLLFIVWGLEEAFWGLRWPSAGLHVFPVHIGVSASQEEVWQWFATLLYLFTESEWYQGGSVWTEAAFSSNFIEGRTVTEEGTEGLICHVFDSGVVAIVWIFWQLCLKEKRRQKKKLCTTRPQQAIPVFRFATFSHTFLLSPCRIKGYNN